ncbi:hypothetical protein DM01DRAFT_1335634 [Hesseltinella vesiculosa]|uniref:C2H2-type domain-containing protein n=1 Tax=Hesseltinella vesiculosa TaxID=101127 RepID=A0A1X2GIF4_9FUNG|nr:hypothetical protein DM01DRAFT_1335634 [Hesseltinella vesiculosa]
MATTPSLYGMSPCSVADSCLADHPYLSPNQQELMIHPLPQENVHGDTLSVPCQPILSTGSVSPSSPITTPVLASLAPASDSAVAVPFQQEQTWINTLYNTVTFLDQAVTNTSVKPVAKEPEAKKKKTPVRRQIYECRYCPYTSNRSNNKNEHELTHDPNRVKGFACLVCQKRFARKHDLKRHHQSHIRQIRKMLTSCGLV